MRPLARALLLAAIGLLPAACDGTAPASIDVAQLRPGALGAGGDPDVTAISTAQTAFDDVSRTYGHPALAARAAAALDYIAGAMSTSSRWGNVSPATKQALLQGREEVRAALGVVPGTPSQVVVDRLTAVAVALDAGDEAAAIRQLGPPAFNAPGAEILARLSNLPTLPMANIATEQALNEILNVPTE